MKEENINMKLKRPLPNNRSFEQLQNHYLVEKAIAEKLKQADREGRKLIYSTMYDELFSKVPDHPRLTRRSSEEQTALANKIKFELVRKFITKSTLFAEFAPGDCKFAIEVAKQVKHVYGIDISNQLSPNDVLPDNFTMIVYDGYNVKDIEENSLDIIFSDQLIEHIHPEDTKHHFKLAYNLLKKGGKYIFRTPQYHSGPHDISAYFADEPEGFHLKEWTYIEIKQLLRELNYSRLSSFWYAKGIKAAMPYIYFEATEKILNLLPKNRIQTLAKYLIPQITVIAEK
jgi:SAM-dependent methyltransferase